MSDPTWDADAERAWESERDEAAAYEANARGRLTPARWRDLDRHTTTVEAAAAWDRARTVRHEDQDNPSGDEL